MDFIELEIDITKSLEENANKYFEKAKKAKKKLKGLLKAKEISKEKQNKEKNNNKKKKLKIHRKKEWYEKFRWFFSSDGFLCIGGRDAISNELIIKKYAEKDDIVFHTDMAGSPFVLIKKNSNKDKAVIPEKTLEEAAIFCASMSRAWKLGLNSIEVFWVKPEQVTKEARAGESLGRGAFVIKGETHYLRPELKLAVSIYDNKVMASPVSAARGKKIIIVPGKEKISQIAKIIKKEFNIDYDLDDIIRVLPPGNSSIVKS